MGAKTKVNSTAKRPSRQPVILRIRNITVRILPTVKGGREYWLVEDYSRGKGKRRLLNARNLAEAKVKARIVAAAIKQGRQFILGLKSSELLALQRCKDLLQGYAQPIDVVASEWAQAVKALRGKATIMDAVQFFVSGKRSRRSPKKL
jgi:hypothetical protein